MYSIGNIVKMGEKNSLLGFIYTQQKMEVNTYSTLIISYTNSIDGKCNIPYEREIPLL